LYIRMMEAGMKESPEYAVYKQIRGDLAHSAGVLNWVQASICSCL
jgi:hypothetical protein